MSTRKQGFDEIVPLQESEHASLDFQPYGEHQGQRAPNSNANDRVDDSHVPLGDVEFSMSRSKVQIDLLNKKSNRYIRGGTTPANKVGTFVDDFDQLRMITHNSDYDNEDVLHGDDS